MTSSAWRPGGGQPVHGCVLAPLIVYLVGGEHAARTLDTWKTWAADHNAAVMAVLFVVFGFKLVGDGIAVLF